MLDAVLSWMMGPQKGVVHASDTTSTSVEGHKEGHKLFPSCLMVASQCHLSQPHQLFADIAVSHLAAGASLALHSGKLKWQPFPVWTLNQKCSQYEYDLTDGEEERRMQQ